MYSDLRKPILHDVLERPGVWRRGGKIRVASTDPARERPLRPHRDARLVPVVARQLSREHDETVLVHPHPRDAVAQGRAEEPHDRLGVPRRGSCSPAADLATAFLSASTVA